MAVDKRLFDIYELPNLRGQTKQSNRKKVKESFEKKTGL